MKKIILPTIALLALLSTAPLSKAWSYNDGDLLLVFRETGFNNIEYDLGSVSNLLGHPNGYVTTITNWNSGLTTSQFGSDLTGAGIILLAVTSPTNASPTAWLSGTEPDTTAYNVSSSAWSSNLHGIISAIGNKPVVPFDLPAAAVTPTNAYSIPPSGIDVGASYDYIVSSGTLNNIPSLGGHSPFSVQQTIPGSFDFWAVQPTSIYPNSPPDKLVGTFNITTAGVLTFTAGPRSSVISAVNHSGNVSSIQFSTTVGNQYWVAYTNQLLGNGIWPIDTTTLTGDGRVDIINHTNSGQSAEYYRINTQ